MFRPLSGNIERKFPITLNVPSNKILDRQALQRRVAEWRHQGQTVVLANGCFDLLHVGHIRYLRAAKALGGRLVVAVNSDASARSLKGEPGDQPGQRHARGHVVVDPDHVGAQTRVDRYLGPVAGPGGGDIPVEVRHGRTPALPGAHRVCVRNPDAG